MDREINGIQRLKVGVSLGVTNMSRVHTGCVQNRGYRVQCSGEDQSDQTESLELAIASYVA